MALKSEIHTTPYLASDFLDMDRMIGPKFAGQKYLDRKSPRHSQEYQKNTITLDALCNIYMASMLVGLAQDFTGIDWMPETDNFPTEIGQISSANATNSLT